MSGGKTTTAIRYAVKCAARRAKVLVKTPRAQLAKKLAATAAVLLAHIDEVERKKMACPVVIYYGDAPLYVAEVGQTLGFTERVREALRTDGGCIAVLCTESMQRLPAVGAGHGVFDVVISDEEKTHVWDHASKLGDRNRTLNDSSTECVVRKARTVIRMEAFFDTNSCVIFPLFRKFHRYENDAAAAAASASAPCAKTRIVRMLNERARAGLAHGLRVNDDDAPLKFLEVDGGRRALNSLAVEMLRRGKTIAFPMCSKAAVNEFTSYAEQQFKEHPCEYALSIVPITSDLSAAQKEEIFGDVSAYVLEKRAAIDGKQVVQVVPFTTANGVGSSMEGENGVAIFDYTFVLFGQGNSYHDQMQSIMRARGVRVIIVAFDAALSCSSSNESTLLEHARRHARHASKAIGDLSYAANIESHLHRVMRRRDAVKWLPPSLIDRDALRGADVSSAAVDDNAQEDRLRKVYARVSALDPRVAQAVEADLYRRLRSAEPQLLYAALRAGMMNLGGAYYRLSPLPAKQKRALDEIDNTLEETRDAERDEIRLRERLRPTMRCVFEGNTIDDLRKLLDFGFRVTCGHEADQVNEGLSCMVYEERHPTPYSKLNDEETLRRRRTHPHLATTLQFADFMTQRTGDWLFLRIALHHIVVQADGDSNHFLSQLDDQMELMNGAKLLMKQKRRRTEPADRAARAIRDGIVESTQAAVCAFFILRCFRVKRGIFDLCKRSDDDDDDAEVDNDQVGSFDETYFNRPIFPLLRKRMSAIANSGVNVPYMTRKAPPLVSGRDFLLDELEQGRNGWLSGTKRSAQDLARYIDRIAAPGTSQESMRARMDLLRCVKDGFFSSVSSELARSIARDAANDAGADGAAAPRSAAAAASRSAAAASPRDVLRCEWRTPFMSKLCSAYAQWLSRGNGLRKCTALLSSACAGDLMDDAALNALASEPSKNVRRVAMAAARAFDWQRAQRDDADEIASLLEVVDEFSSSSEGEIDEREAARRFRVCREALSNDIPSIQLLKAKVAENVSMRAVGDDDAHF